MNALPNRHESLQQVYKSLESLIDDIGTTAAADQVGVSPDTVRRRIRGTQPWFFEEVFELARHEITRGTGKEISTAIIRGLRPTDAEPGRPLLLPSNLREMLRLVGRLTAEIADTLDDGRVDASEAENLVHRLDELSELIGGLRRDLRPLMK